MAWSFPYQTCFEGEIRWSIKRDDDHGVIRLDEWINGRLINAWEFESARELLSLADQIYNAIQDEDVTANERKNFGKEGEDGVIPSIERNA